MIEGRKRWILAVAAMAQLMVVLDVTVVNVALPSAQAALHFGNADRQWIVTAYSLAFGSMLLLGGKLGDLFGRKWTLIGGATGFALASAIGGSAQSFVMLAGARAAQGAFAALLAPAALSILTTTFTESSARDRALGIYGGIGASGASVGLLLGGALTQWLDWRYVMYVNVVFAAIVVLGAVALLASEKPQTKPRLDIPGTLAVSGGLFALVFGLSRAETAGWGNALTIASLAAGIALLALFTWIETRAAEPLLPLRVVTDRRRGASLASLFISAGAMFAVFLFLTYYVQEVLGYGAFESGLAFLPMTIVLLATATTLSGRLVRRFGPGLVIAAGMAVSAAGMLYLTRLGTHASYAADILPTMIAMGAGLGLIFPTAIDNGTRDVDAADAGVASATVNTSQQIGGSIGTALLSTIASSATSTYVAAHAGATTEAAVHGYTTAFTWSAAAFAAGALVALLLYGRAKPAVSDSTEPVLAV